MDSIIKEKIVSLLVPELKPKMIILFGSYAAGRQTADSDLDLLVIEESCASKMAEKRRIRRMLAGIDLPKDILVATMEEFEFYRQQAGSVFREAFEKGIIVWSG